MPDNQPITFSKPPAKREKHSWGFSETLTTGPGFRTIRLTISPLKSIELRWHRHQDLQWVVARGTAKVLVDGKEQTLGRGQSVEIARTFEYRVENYSSVDPLEIIEVQTGEYIGEDDVVYAET